MQPNRVLFGFVCAALSIFFFHQATISFYSGMGWIPAPGYRPTPIPPWGVPQLWNAVFWGGLWGLVFAVLEPRRPTAMPLWLFTVLFCLLLPLVVGAWIIVPLIKGLPLFAGGNTTAMTRSLGIYATWGFGLALFWRGLPALFRKE